jgi:hypothetical protein
MERHTVDSKFLNNMIKRYESENKENKQIKAPNLDMYKILENTVQIPSKLFLGNTPEMTSVKPKKSGENPLQTGKGKQMFEE